MCVVTLMVAVMFPWVRRLAGFATSRVQRVDLIAAPGRHADPIAP